MNILAINTTNKFAEVVCSKDGSVVQNKIDNAFSEHVMASLTKTLDESKLEIGDIDVLGVVIGPGSFTGIRIGMAVVKGIVSALKTKCVAVNSFEIVSYNINSKNFIVLLDSGNAEHYYAIFKNGEMQEVGHNNIDAIKLFAKERQLDIYFDAHESEVFGNIDGLIKVDVAPNSLIKVATKKVKENQFADIKTLSPIYIKVSQAEMGLEQKIKEHVHYRTALLTDVEALSVIDEQCFDGYEKYSKDSFAQELSLADRHYIVAVFDNLVIGYVGLWKTGDDLNLLKIAVLPQYRSLGIGFNLMQLAGKYRSDEKLDKYFLEVREHNEKAIRLYKKFGFKTANTREKYYADGENCLVMFAK